MKEGGYYLRALGRVGSDVKREVIAAHKEAGGQMDPWNRLNFERLCNAMTKVEDRLELASNRMTPARLALRTIRRELEVELWP